jgi:hypothetical protein
MSEFSRLAGQQCPPHESLALELGATRVSEARRTLGVDLSWRCAHEATGVLLRHVTAAAERSGDAPAAALAAELGTRGHRGTNDGRSAAIIRPSMILRATVTA